MYACSTSIVLVDDHIFQFYNDVAYFEMLESHPLYGASF